MSERKKDCIIVTLIMFYATVIIFCLTMRISYMTTGDWFNKTDLFFFGAWSSGCALFIYGWVADCKKAKKEMLDYE